MQNYDLQSKIFKALMHPARLAILELLRDGEQCVCHLETFLGLRQAYISQQLMILREAGLVQDRRDGWNIFYRVVKPEVYEIITLASKMNNGKDTVHRHAPDPKTRRSDCPCPKCHPVVENAPG